jgi:hypothetical protein
MGRAHLFDHGLCTLLVVALLMGLPRGDAAGPVPLRFLYALVILFMPNPRMNVASVLSGTLFLFALYRTLALPPATFGSARGRAAVLGLVVAATCALRPSFVLPALGLVAASLIASSRSVGRKAAVEEAVAIAVVLGLAMLPWCVSLYRSNQTFSFPPFHGGYHPESGFTKFVLGRYRFDQFTSEMRNFEPVGTIHLFFLAGVLMTDESPRRAMQASFWSLFLLGFLALLVLVPIVDFKSLARYRAPAEVAFMLVVASHAFGRECSGKDLARNLAGGAIVILACCFELAWQHESSTTSFNTYLEDAHTLLLGDELADPLDSPDREDLADRLQSSVPAGAPLLVMVGDAYRLDFRRNPIEILDVPGIVSPDEGIPAFQGPDALADYLRAHGLRYIAMIDPWQAGDLYDRPSWEKNANDAVSYKMPQNFIARYVLDVFDSLDRLKRTRRHVFEAGDTMVLDLESVEQ